jgi:cytoplasmic iron level regulating protein YaaA (DUF328/UPF0246 family)
MIIILSPAKTLAKTFDFTTNNYNDSNQNITFAKTTPVFLQKANLLAHHLKQFNCQEIAEICQISPKLATLNQQRWQDFQQNSGHIAKQAIFAFRGDVYKQLDLAKYQEPELTYLKNNVLILSGLYGILKPSDLILPYRLEMSSNFAKYNFFIDNLYSFWQKDLTNYCKNYELIINLSSNEYAKALQKKQLNIIDIVFLDYQHQKLKNIGINAKKARGKMTDLLIKNKITNIADLKNLQPLNYIFSPADSSNQRLVFIR